MQFTYSKEEALTATLGVGIYGAGHVSREHIRAYLKNPATEVVAICSRTREGAAARASDSALTATIVWPMCVRRAGGQLAIATAVSSRITVTLI